LVAKAKRDFPPIPDNIKLRIDDSSGSARVTVVADRVVEILFNLVAHAIEAMPEGGEIIFTAQVKEENVEFLVQDTGEGILPDNIDEIFNLLFTTKPEGAGFDLWSSRIEARKEVGELTVKRDPGHGSTFILTLPLQSAPGSKDQMG
jgi:signal transduction histidine kinase